MDLVPPGGCGATGSAPDLDGATAIFGQRVSRFVSHREAPGFGGAVPGRVGLTQSCALVEPKLMCQVIRGEPGGGAGPETGDAYGSRSKLARWVSQVVSACRPPVTRLGRSVANRRAARPDGIGRACGAGFVRG